MLFMYVAIEVKEASNKSDVNEELEKWNSLTGYVFSYIHGNQKVLHDNLFHCKRSKTGRWERPGNNSNEATW